MHKAASTRKNFASSRFWEELHRLPLKVQKLARKSYRLFLADRQHPSLQFKKVGRFWSVRLGSNYRALAVDVPDGLLWVWIGSHDEYERLIR